MLKVSVKRDRRARAALESVRRELADVTKGGGGVLAKRLKAAVGDVDRKQNQRHFATEGKSTGKRFVALSPAYERQKRKRWGRKPILTASGALRDSLRFARGKGRIERTERSPTTGGLRMVFGTSVPYALHLHRGKYPLRGRRPPIRKTPAQIQALKETIKREILRRVDEVTGGKLLTNQDHRIPASLLGRAIHGERS